MSDESQDKLPDPAAAPVPAVAEPPESLSALVRQYPAAVFAGGLAVGLLAGALLPKRSSSGKLGKQVLALAATAGELGMALGQQALDRTQDAARETRSRLADLGETASEAGKRAASAGADARKSGLKLAKKAIELAAKAKR